MWWGRKDEDANSAAAKKKRTASTPSKKSRLGSGRQKGAPASASLVSRRRPRLGKKNKSSRNMEDGGGEEDVRLASTRLVRAFNVLGLPALSMPCGLDRSGMPIGLQIAGPAFCERRILELGAVLESVFAPPRPSLAAD